MPTLPINGAGSSAAAASAGAERGPALDKLPPRSFLFTLRDNCRLAAGGYRLATPMPHLNYCRANSVCSASTGLWKGGGRERELGGKREEGDVEGGGGGKVNEGVGERVIGRERD